MRRGVSLVITVVLLLAAIGCLIAALNSFHVAREFTDAPDRTALALALSSQINAERWALASILSLQAATAVALSLPHRRHRTP